MQHKNDIQAIIFDVGGVLDRPADTATEEMERQQLAAKLGLDLDAMWRLFYQGENWKLARTGVISDAEFWQRNLSPFGITDPAAQQTFAQRLNAHREVNVTMRSLLDDLHGRIRLAVISNASDTLETGLEQRYQISHYFELIVNSARVALAKPDPAIFEWTLAQLQLRPEQTLFTDDQQHNVNAASELGMHAVLFTGAAELRRHLVELGILPA